MRAEWDDLDTHERAKRLGRQGAPALGVRVSIDPQGEVLTSSNHNLDGYWEQPEETARVTEGGTFHTGDGGYLDEDGYLVISDRKKDVIISGGENVSSIEVEDALMSHPAVKEVAVIGIPDEKWGELITALVVPTADDVTAEDLIAHCREVAGRLQVPEAGRLRRRAAAHGHRQAAEVQAARAVLEGPGPPGQLANRVRTARVPIRAATSSRHARTRIPQNSLCQPRGVSPQTSTRKVPTTASANATVSGRVAGDGEPGA